MGFQLSSPGSRAVQKASLSESSSTISAGAPFLQRPIRIQAINTGKQDTNPVLINGRVRFPMRCVRGSILLLTFVEEAGNVGFLCLSSIGLPVEVVLTQALANYCSARMPRPLYGLGRSARATIAITVTGIHQRPP